MQITVEVPELIANQMREKWGELPQKILELLAVEAYRAEVITSSEVGKMLKLSHRLEVDEFLKKEGAYLQYDEADFERDLRTMQKFEREGKLKR
jgi:predicted HTH domain antitoxin